MLTSRSQRQSGETNRGSRLASARQGRTLRNDAKNRLIRLAMRDVELVAVDKLAQPPGCETGRARCAVGLGTGTKTAGARAAGPDRSLVCVMGLKILLQDRKNLFELFHIC